MTDYRGHKCGGFHRRTEDAFGPVLDHQPMTRRFADRAESEREQRLAVYQRRAVAGLDLFTGTKPGADEADALPHCWCCDEPAPAATGLRWHGWTYAAVIAGNTIRRVPMCPACAEESPKPVAIQAA